MMKNVKRRKNVFYLTLEMGLDRHLEQHDCPHFLPNHESSSKV